MQHCVLALCTEAYYFSVLCYYQGDGNPCETLNESHRSMMAAEKLIAGGNICFYDGLTLNQYRSDSGYPWNEVKPVMHEDSIEFIEHALEVNATHIICFQGEFWDEIPILSIELPDATGFATCL